MTPTANPVLSVLDGVPPLSFTAPAGLFTLPLAATPEERVALSKAFVRELYSRGDEALWTPAAPFYEALAEQLAHAGVSYSAMGLFSTDDGGVVRCSLTVAAVETEQTDAEIAAHGILTALSSDPRHDARWLDLPCGPAVSCVTLREVILSPEVTASGTEERLLAGQIQVYIPFPTGPHTAVFTLDTASTEYWGEFCDMTVAMLRTLSFADPGAGPADS